MNTKIKICGLRREQDIAAANRLRPDYIGFVFAPGKRQISAEKAASLRALLAPDILSAGVFVNPKEEDVIMLCRRGVIDIIQLHGDENDAFITRMKKRTGVPVIKSVAIGSSIPPFSRTADFLLFDTAGISRGGTGKTFDWDLLKGFRETPYFLAGGLHTANIRCALGKLAPYAVDVSSGVETDGWKDAGKMEAFISRVRTMKPSNEKGVCNE